MSSKNPVAKPRNPSHKINKEIENEVSKIPKATLTNAQVKIEETFGSEKPPAYPNMGSNIASQNGSYAVLVQKRKELLQRNKQVEKNLNSPKDVITSKNEFISYPNSFNLVNQNDNINQKLTTKNGNRSNLNSPLPSPTYNSQNSSQNSQKNITQNYPNLKYNENQIKDIKNQKLRNEPVNNLIAVKENQNYAVHSNSQKPTENGSITKIPLSPKSNLRLNLNINTNEVPKEGVVVSEHVVIRRPFSANVPMLITKSNTPAATETINTSYSNLNKANIRFAYLNSTFSNQIVNPSIQFNSQLINVPQRVHSADNINRNMKINK